MKINAKLSICRCSDGTIHLSINDDASNIQFVDMEILPKHFANAVTGLSYQPMKGEVRGLEFVGKKYVREDRSIKHPPKDKRPLNFALPEGSVQEKINDRLLFNLPVAGILQRWMLDSSLRSQSSIGPGNTLNYSVYKYVSKEDPK